MRTKHVLSFFSFFLLSYLAQAQQMTPDDPALRQRLMKYVADNHLSPDGNYIYFDTVIKRPVRFIAGSFLVEDASARSPGANSTAGKAGAPSIAGAAGNFHLVKDINAATNSSPSTYDYFAAGNAQHYAVLNDVAYFSANDGIHGEELWRSDGTASGTYLVKDILPGEQSSNPYYLFSIGGKLYFSFYNNSIGNYELWTSDGTTDGTVQITPPDNPFNGTPSSFCEVNGTVYFTATKSYFYNSLLWKTDGTAAGTTLVKDFSNNTTQALLHNLVAANGLLFFVAFDPATGDELYRSDGTDTGTYLVKNTYYESYKGPSQLTAYDSKLYFEANDGSGSKLWVTDGTTAGTGYASGYNNVQLYAYGNYFFGTNEAFLVSNNVLYFPGYTSTTGWELYKYDASSAEGAVVVEDITPGSNGYVIPYTNMADVNGIVYFGYTDAGGDHLYKTNGSGVSTVDIKDFSAGSLSRFYNGNGKLYFSSYATATGLEPWTSDGTTAGTSLLADIYTGDINSVPLNYTPLSKGVLFEATDSLHGSELFISDGAEVKLLKDINTTTTSSSDLLYKNEFNDGVIFRAFTYEKGYEPWKANTSNASLIKDINPGQSNSYPYEFMQKNGISYFKADTDTGNYEIYKTDGTAAGTIKVFSNAGDGNLISFTVTDNSTVYYLLRNTNYSFELWKTDGTNDGNMQLHTFSNVTSTNNSSGGYFYSLIAIGNTVYLGAADDSSSDLELWKSDGTIAGTVLVKDINPGSNSSSPQQLTAFNNHLFFSAYDTTGNGLWTSDGTAAGTIKLLSEQPSALTDGGKALFFTAYTATFGNELWKTDGTVTGTSLVKEIISGTGSSSLSLLTNVNGTLFFTAVDSTSEIGLWTSDGTANNTVSIATIGASTSTNIEGVSAAADSKLFFVVNSQLWVSNGTNEGTGKVSDAVLDGLSYVDRVTASNNQLFLEGYNYKYGYELYAGDATLTALPVVLASFTASLKSNDVITQWKTTSEINTSYFNLQRSIDGVHFTDAGKVMAKGNSNTLQNYSFPDVNIANLVSAKTIYYRLQTIDKDGKTSLSKIVPVNLNWKDVVVLLLPNPVKDVLKIQVSNYAGSAIIDLYDVSGKKLSSSQQTLQSGNNISINVSTWQAGVYIVKMNLNGRIIQQKFVKE